MSRQEFPIALSHAVLAGTSIYCLSEVKNMDPFCPQITYGIIATNSILGVIWWLMDYNSKLNDIVRLTAYCQLLFALPCITTTVWLQNGYAKDWSWAWAVVPIFPLLMYILHTDIDMPLADLIIVFNIVGLGVVSFVKEINYGIGAVVAYIVAHGYGRRLDLTRQALYSYVMCVFAYCSLRAIGRGQDLF